MSQDNGQIGNADSVENNHGDDGPYPDGTDKRQCLNLDTNETEAQDNSQAVKADPADRKRKIERGDDEEADGGVAMKLMRKMGYKEGKGLGTQEQGRTKPVELSTQRGRRGLGHVIPGFEPHTVSAAWDPTQEEITYEEFVEWMPSCSKSPPILDEMEGWIQMGTEKKTIHDETRYCSAKVLADMLEAKNVFDHLSDRELRTARTRANPFETIKGVFFQNRAAMKMANMDAVFDFIFTSPKDSEGKPIWDKNSDELFLFADICAGPGGFTEYILWKLGFNAHGFGFTLKGECDFKLHMFAAASPEMFEPFYGKSGTEGTGDITDPENLKAFRSFVMLATEDKGLHLVMADGGFSVEGQENIQEILSKRIYLCQFLCAISVLRPGGNFVCKLFDLFTPFSVGLIYLMYRAFDAISIHKPHTSRPANSERYLICRGFRTCNDLHKFMFKANELMQELDSPQDISSVVTQEVIDSAEEFKQYIIDSNERMARRQTMYLNKYKTFAQNQNLYDPGQKDLRAKCLEYWLIPDHPRPMHPRPAPQSAIVDLCQNQNLYDPGQKDLRAKCLEYWLIPDHPRPIHPRPAPQSAIVDLCQNQNLYDPGQKDLRAKCLEYWLIPDLPRPMHHRPAPQSAIVDLCEDTRFLYTGVTKPLEEETMSNIFQYRVVVSSALPTFILALGRTFVFQWEVNRWSPLNSIQLQIPRNTLIYGEITREQFSVGKLEQYRNVVNIVDAFFLNGENVGSLPFQKRVQKARKFCRAISKEYSRRELGIMRVAPSMSSQNFPNFVSSFKLINYRNVERAGFVLPDTDVELPVRGLYLVPIVSEPWTIPWSKSGQRCYFFNQKNGKSVFELPDDCAVSFKKLCQERLIQFWQWTIANSKVILSLEQEKEAQLTLEDFCGQITRLKPAAAPR